MGLQCLLCLKWFWDMFSNSLLSRHSNIGCQGVTGRLDRMWSLRRAGFRPVPGLQVPWQLLGVVLLLGMTSSVPVDKLDLVELYSGAANLSKAAASLGSRIGRMDIVLHHNHDLCGIRGFLCSRQLSIEKAKTFCQPFVFPSVPFANLCAMAKTNSVQDGSASGDAAYFWHWCSLGCSGVFVMDVGEQEHVQKGYPQPSRAPRLGVRVCRKPHDLQVGVVVYGVHTQRRQLDD